MNIIDQLIIKIQIIIQIQIQISDSISNFYNHVRNWVPQNISVHKTISGSQSVDLGL